MATETTIGGRGDFFKGEDKILKLRVFAAPASKKKLVDITGWDVVWVVRQTDAANDPALLQKTAVIEGTFHEDPAIGTQWATVTLSDDDTNLLPRLGIAAYRHAWKRMDVDRETVLSYGALAPQWATAH